MRVATVGNYAVTIGWLIALIVLLIAIFGLIGVVPFTATAVFLMLGGLAIARLV